MNFYTLLIIFGWLASIFFLALFIRNRFTNNSEVTRKIIHIGSGPLIPLAIWLDISRQIIIPIALTITTIIIINNQIKIIPGIEDIERKSFGTIAYCLSISFLLILLWPKNSVALMAGVLVMSFGDGLAGLIGKEFKSRQWKFMNQTKSIIGTSVMAITSTIVLLIVAYTYNVNTNLFVIGFIALISVILEQFSILGVDNFTVPIGVTFLWKYFETL